MHQRACDEKRDELLATQPQADTVDALITLPGGRELCWQNAEKEEEQGEQEQKEENTAGHLYPDLELRCLWPGLAFIEYGEKQGKGLANRQTKSWTPVLAALPASKMLVLEPVFSDYWKMSSTRNPLAGRIQGTHRINCSLCHCTPRDAPENESPLELKSGCGSLQG